MKAKVSITFNSVEEAEQVRESICPDNSPLPSGMEIDTTIEGNILVITITCEKGIDSFRGTIEDMMSAIDLSIRVFDLTN